MNKKVSVIIPVYNTEAFLDRCIESIVNQVYKNLEIILVDDGSSDRSGVLCDNWANKDSRIRVIHKPNGGVSSARNIGIEKAQGELIQFIDSDDYVNDDYIGNMVDIFEKHDVDMVITGFKIINDRKKDIEKRLLGNYAFNLSPENRDVFLNLLVNGFMTYVVTKMYKKESIKYQFNESTPLGEDIIFNLKNARDMSSIGICTGSGYVYEFNETSATHKKRDNMFDIQKKSIDEIANFLDLKFNTHNIGDFYQIMGNLFITCITRSTKQGLPRVISEMKKYPLFLEYKKNYKPVGLGNKLKKFLLKHHMFRTITLISKIKHL